ncbi:FHA domain-containing protein [Lujinxingia sediminis]|uniref:FHA domain-containing protein n=1 Tax=Lujinxingia sediminis TaxID=2480984 RepID=A0ABY0CZ72_9DELT|nr:FHA domain-containing protein [Lujinxingia sediminis]RVU48750.1 FHA domain-containing protein [Lujinxingia sediminis]
MSDSRDKSLPFDVDDADLFSSVADDHVLSSAPIAPPASSHMTSPAPAPASTRRVGRAHQPEAFLDIESPGRSPQRVRLQGPRFLLGGERADLTLDDRFVSRWHAQLSQEQGAWVLEDLGSHNGVYLRIADEFVMEDGDEIIVGAQRLAFRTGWDAGQTQTVPTLGAPKLPTAPRLVEYVEGGHIRGIYPIVDSMLIGREGADLNFPHDELLSSPHASFERHDGQFYLRDLISESGTFIRIRGAVELIDGDCFCVGRTRLQVRYQG